MKKLSSGGRIRTYDLRVMSPTSYLCSTPHSLNSLEALASILLSYQDSNLDWLIQSQMCYHYTIGQLRFS